MIYFVDSKLTFTGPAAHDRALTQMEEFPEGAAVLTRVEHELAEIKMLRSVVNPGRFRLATMEECRRAARGQRAPGLAAAALLMLLFMLFGSPVQTYAGGLAETGKPALAASKMILGRIDTAAPALLAEALPDPRGHESLGWMLTAGAATVVAVGSLLAFLRRESQMQSPKTEHNVSGGPVTIRHEEIYVERHEHAGLQKDLEHHKKEIWEVVKGLRAAVGRIETSTSNTEVLREANGALLTEVREEVSSLGKLVARLTAIVETKLEAKHK